MDYSVFWDYLGTVWSPYENKETIETFWQGLHSGIMHMYGYLAELQKSKSMLYMSPTFDIGPEFYNVIYSGVDETVVNVYPTTSGLFEFMLPEWSYSVPTLTYSYTYNGTPYSGTYTEGVDYLVSGYNSLHWIGTLPAPDPRYPSTIKRCSLYAEKIHIVNPVLMNLWAIFCGFKIDYLADYDSYGQNQYTHLKMLIWALVYKQMQAPSVKMLSDMFAISRGQPFAYAAGTATVSDMGTYFTVTIGSTTYTLPAGMTPIANGTIVEQFDVIAEGITLDDIHSNASLVNLHANAYNRRNTLVYTIGAGASTYYNATFHIEYVNKLLPEQMQWFEI